MVDFSKANIKDVKFGSNIKIVEPVNLYSCEIADNCFIGPFVEIQKNVKIGKNTRIQSHSFICELTSIGDNCFIGHGVMFINDVFKDGKLAGGNKKLWKNTRIGNNVLIGSNSTILPVEICDNVVIGAGSVITKPLIEPGTYMGNPARKKNVNN